MKIVYFYILFILLSSYSLTSQNIYTKSNDRTVWVSFENPTGEKGAGGTRNQGAKGHAFDNILAGDSCELLSMDGPGIINRIWMTVSQRNQEILQALRLKIYWDGSNFPAVDVPLGDFFCNGNSQMAVFENCFFSNPESRSMNAYIPMPFRESARIVVINKSTETLTHLFYDINLSILNKWDSDYMYFHSYHNQASNTVLGEDYLILPKVNGEGRFLGVSLGVTTNKQYKDTWWGEGEIKIYLDGDKEYPSLCGTGVEDYVGTAWGMGAYYNWYQGCQISDAENGKWSLYRFHLPDPIYFKEDCRVTLQQIGGAPYEEVLELHSNGVPLKPITVDQSHKGSFIRLLELNEEKDLADPNFPKGWVNFYRQDEISSVAYFYLDKPHIE